MTKHLLQGTALVLALTFTAGLQGHAAEVDTIAVLVPEQGTDFGWNQQGVDAARAAAAATGVWSGLGGFGSMTGLGNRRGGAPAAAGLRSI